MITRVVLGEETRAEEWILIPVVRMHVITGESWGSASAEPTGIIGLHEKAAWFFPLVQGIGWEDVGRELFTNNSRKKQEIS